MKDVKETAYYLTLLERQVLDEVTKNEYYEDGLDSDVYVESLLNTSGLIPKQARGAISSLIKKEIIYHMDKYYPAIQFTEFGKEVMKELGYEDDED